MADLRLLALTHLLAAGAGFAVAPRELLETEVVHNGFFETDTKRVLAAAVESLRSENRLMVYSYKGFAAVSVERDGFLLFDGRQELIVPAAVSVSRPPFEVRAPSGSSATSPITSGGRLMVMTREPSSKVTCSAVSLGPSESEVG